jgi:hypothetical protein
LDDQHVEQGASGANIFQSLIPTTPEPRSHSQPLPHACVTSGAFWPPLGY